MWGKIGVALVLGGAVVAGVVHALSPDRPPRWGEWITSRECRVCHPLHHDSWARTYHRTMTTPATPEHVGAPIEDTTLNVYGIPVRFQRRGDRYFVTLPYLDGKIHTFPIRFFIGSHRMQQFAIDVNGVIHRIPVFYSIQDRRFFPIPEAFFRRERPPGMESFLDGYGLWNVNCIFCHNTGPHPNLDPQLKVYRSTVEELGIACEECHAPGRTHARKNRNPLRRLLFTYFRKKDPTIVHPEKLPPLRAVQVCGQCHGQRLPHPLNRIGELITRGDPYIPGEDLFTYYKPLAPDDTLPDYKLFHLRFWKDGTPRLTAYELQGLLAAPCFLNQRPGEPFTCTTCHRAHEGDPAGMIPPEMRTDLACTQCHQTYADPETRRAHTHHPPEVRCQDCHMPAIVYGVMSIHPSHRIENPDPTVTARWGRPNACNLCHLDKSVFWATEEVHRLWGLPVMGPPDPRFQMPEALRGFGEGDVVYRVILVEHLKRWDLRTPWVQQVLKEALRDPYPIVRTFARRVLAARGIPWEEAAAWAEQIPPAEELEALIAARQEEEFEFGE